MPNRTKLCSKEIKEAKFYQNFKNIEMLHIKIEKKGEKWPQINQVLVNSKRNKEK